MPRMVAPSSFCFGDKSSLEKKSGGLVSPQPLCFFRDLNELLLNRVFLNFYTYFIITSGESSEDQLQGGGCRLPQASVCHVLVLR